jgi:lysophospholipase L1-like esterase
MTRKIAVHAAVAGVLPVLLAVPAAAQQPSFAKYVAVGDSLTAGFSNLSLVLTHQEASWPLLLAQQAGIGATTFQQPYVTDPGIPAELALLSLVPSPVIAPKSTDTGLPANYALDRPYDNLAVPGATSVDVVTRTTGGMNDLVLRGRGTQLQQAVSLHPTFVTVWIGSNDVLGAATSGKAIDGVTMVPLAAFRAAYAQIISSLVQTGATVVTATIPDPTAAPFANAIPPVVVNPATGKPVLIGGHTVPLIGPSGPLPADAKVTLGASPLLAKGVGIPTALGGSGEPLPDEVVLDPTELATIRDRVSAVNQSIRDIAGAAGVAVLDLNAFTTDILTNGRSYAGVTLDGSFLTGGLVGYDGIHPTNIGYAYLANAWIDFLNNQKGTHLSPVSLAPYVFGTSSTSSTAVAMAPGTPAAGTSEFSQEAYDMLRALFPPPDVR